MNERVLEVFATDGSQLVNLVTPAPRPILEAATPTVQRLLTTLRWDA